jgi:hypothetical protein
VDLHPPSYGAQATLGFFGYLTQRQLSALVRVAHPLGVLVKEITEMLLPVPGSQIWSSTRTIGHAGAPVGVGHSPGMLSHSPGFLTHLFYDDLR